MTNDRHNDETRIDLSDSSIAVETVEFPFEMAPPEFGEIYTDIEGVVVDLNDTVFQDQDSLVLKGPAEEAVNLIAPSSLVDSGVIAAPISDIGLNLDGYHYYTFADEFTLYSEYAVNLIFG